ncbi:unnamed protein product [Nesidiocoris tenuis]|uniref:Rab9 effector protein with kelch motifs n=1 Tax=Nesidiocoris tenuis TaxID=355587 RepID=A0A6H5G9K9_9HEMI|nr:unnamed protein product [Nesidiocoris tenuis]CAB0012070.1 unnamed protein product [Nesidiocoris tenuis]
MVSSQGNGDKAEQADGKDDLKGKSEELLIYFPASRKLVYLLRMSSMDELRHSEPTKLRCHVSLAPLWMADSEFQFKLMWSPVTPKNDATEKTPTSRSKHSVTLHGDHLYLIAGRNGNIPLKDIWRYSLVDGVWEKLEPNGDHPPNLQEHTAVAFRDSIYVFGGEVSEKTESWHLLSNGKVYPPPRHKHSMVIHDGSIWIYGGMTDLQERSDLWRFDTATETWEKLWLDGIPPQPRSESVALTIPELLLQNNTCVSKSSPRKLRGGGSVDRQNGRPKSSMTSQRGPTPCSSNLSILKEISKFSQLNLTRMSQNNKCNYSMLSSSESISETSLGCEMVKSQSHHVIAKSLMSPMSVSNEKTTTLSRDPISVPNFASLASSTLTPVEVTKLVYLDDEEAPIKPSKPDFSSIHQQFQPKMKRGITKSASVRFGKNMVTPEESDQTSDYASIETMNKISSFNDKNKKDKEGPYSFSNPNYMGPDIKDILREKECVQILNSPPDSVLEDKLGRSTSTTEMIELKPIPPKSLALASTRHHYNDDHDDPSTSSSFRDKKGRALSASRAEKDVTAFCVFVVGGKERGQVTVFKRPLSMWKLQLCPSIY